MDEWKKAIENINEENYSEEGGLSSDQLQRVFDVVEKREAKIRSEERNKRLTSCCPSCGGTIVIYEPMGVGGKCGLCGNPNPFSGNRLSGDTQ